MFRTVSLDHAGLLVEYKDSSLLTQNPTLALLETVVSSFQSEI
jgi:hypothetical protein